MFTVLTEVGQKGHICVAPAGVGCNVPAPTPSTTTPPVTVAGQWEFVGFSHSGEAIDIVHLTLVDFPPGHLTGSWAETAAPGYQPGLALNGTECAGCNGVSGAYHNEFGVVGKTLEDEDFTITVENDANTSLSGGLGDATPYGATRYGCRAYIPDTSTAMNERFEMFLVSGSSAYLFYRPVDFFPSPAVGRKTTCL
jgi:hypothetical protein